MEVTQAKNGEVISTKECREYLKKHKLGEQKVALIRDNLVGIIDNIINSYIEEFK